MKGQLLRDATVLFFDPDWRVARADLEIGPDGRIAQILPPGSPRRRGTEDLDLAGRFVLPGLVQTHLHLCQTLFRGAAERLPLSSWLRTRIWPLEAAHDAETVAAAARLGALELVRGGATAVLDMGTTRHVASILEACEEAGIRARTGTALMDRGEEVPAELLRDGEEALAETAALLRRWPGAPQDRVGLCLAPRFLPSVSEPLWRALAALADSADLLIHTHACETAEEIRLTQERAGGRPIELLDRLGITGPRLRAAHGVWLEAEEIEILARSGSAVVHCPGSNAKLGSGSADLLRLRRAGIRTGIGCDGAACNNRLDLFEEMRRAAHLASLLHGPEAVDPAEILSMATREGADLLGLGDRIGSVEVGKEADLIALTPDPGWGAPGRGGDPFAEILYGAAAEQVQHVWIAGEWTVRDQRAVRVDAVEIQARASRAAAVLRERTGEA